MDSVYRHKRHYVNFDHNLAAASAVLNVQLHGTSQDPREKRRVHTTDLNSGEETAIKAAISQDLILQGTSDKEYMNTWGVERYLHKDGD